LSCAQPCWAVVSRLDGRLAATDDAMGHPRLKESSPPAETADTYSDAIPATQEEAAAAKSPGRCWEARTTRAAQTSSCA
jgi:hypothetical protein